MPREKWFLLTCCCHRYTPAMFCDKADQRCCFGNQFAEQAWDECRTVAPPCTEATKITLWTVPVPPISMLLRGFDTEAEFILKRLKPNIEIRWDMGRCHSEASKPCIRQSPGQIFILNSHSKRRQKSLLLFPKAV